MKAKRRKQLTAQFTMRKKRSTDVHSAPVDLPRCTCGELTKTWRPEDRESLCGHLRECPRFPENFSARR